MTAGRLIGLACAWALAVVLFAAAGAKLRAPDRTADEFTSLGLAGGPVLARVVPVVEIATGAVILLAPRWGGPMAFALLAAFTVVLASVLRSGRIATCACFGGSSKEPISSRHLVRNGALLAAAAVATFLPGSALDLTGP